jgi:hypothetical protein
MSDIEEESGGNVFDALAADNAVAADDVHHRKSLKIYRLPVTLYTDDKSGEQFFYLQKSTFPGRSITDLKIIYSDSEKSQVREQVLADKSCPEIILHDAQVECLLGRKSENDDPNAILTDESFRLSGSKIG